SATGRGIKACLLSPAHSNPSGATMADAEKAALVALCRRHGVALIEDDLYGELQFSGRRRLPLRHFDADVILCGSFSKTLAPGARVGWIAAARHAEPVRRLKFAASVTTAPLLQEAVAELLEGGVYDRHLRRFRAACELQLRHATRLVLEAFPEGTRVMQPDGGFLLWVQLPVGTDALELYRRAIAEGIEFAPGALFGSGFADCLRLNCGHRITPRIERAIRRLGALARA
ncbi:MAG: PLP-dependent aminotransferase family protein, partial [Gammaproteobacteria bacterium]